MAVEVRKKKVILALIIGTVVVVLVAIGVVVLIVQICGHAPGQFGLCDAPQKSDDGR